MEPSSLTESVQTIIEVVNKPTVYPDYLTNVLADKHLYSFDGHDTLAIESSV